MHTQQLFIHSIRYIYKFNCNTGDNDGMRCSIPSECHNISLLTVEFKST